MASTKEKKEIYKLWGEAFPCLTAFSPTAFYMTLDIAVIGIRLMPLIGGEEYRPHFMCYPLWRENNNMNMKDGIFMQQMYNAKKMQLDVSYLANQDTIKKAIDLTGKQIGTCVQDQVSVKDIFGILKWYFSYILVQSSPILQSKVLEYEFMIALYINNPNFIDKVKTEITKISNSWDPNYFEWRHGKIEDWRQRLFDRLENRDAFLLQIQKNINDGKIAKLPRAHMIFSDRELKHLSLSKRKYFHCILNWFD
ncbi:hypothetical protein H8784_14085 [Parabacteroides acidifaciens]|uniref:Uncharacterized protein n=1 Tax=Parabacteroides acidifaciens TaxID=2290935 RepID=A0A3D8HBU7_9BACT|nr:hypothetical protein [Parabacteroides acidifaciens]MBC8602844.1 hypothetical protein [Parabacteroides acidifaciens]RDU48465.1 hypothetical protein DWU89_14450 [Parabacteroides acidifaciens]